MENKVYKYRGFEFYKTNIVHVNSGKYLYEIIGLKDAGKRPFLITIKDCKEYINNIDCYTLKD